LPGLILLVWHRPFQGLFFFWPLFAPDENPFAPYQLADPSENY
jgi:hypothetical protein